LIYRVIFTGGVVMLQGSPAAINSPARQHEPSGEWLGQRRCGKAAGQGLALAVRGQIARL